MKFRIDYKSLLLCYKAQKGLAPTNPADILTPTKSLRTRRPSRKNQLVKPKARPKIYGDRVFAVYGPTIWNKLPEYIHCLDKIDNFKKGLKTYLLKCVFKHA